MTQNEQILNHLERGGSLTVLEALQKFGCYALSQRGAELKREGYPVKSEMVKLPNGKVIARYSLQGIPGIAYG